MAGTIVQFRIGGGAELLCSCGADRALAAESEEEPERTQVSELSVSGRYVLSENWEMGISYLGLRETGVLGRI